MKAFGSVNDTEMLERALNLSISPETRYVYSIYSSSGSLSISHSDSVYFIFNNHRNQDGVAAIVGVASNPKGRELVWQFIQRKYVLSPMYLPSHISHLSINPSSKNSPQHSLMINFLFSSPPLHSFFFFIQLVRIICSIQGTVPSIRTTQIQSIVLLFFCYDSRNQFLLLPSVCSWN